MIRLTAWAMLWLAACGGACSGADKAPPPTAGVTGCKRDQECGAGEACNVASGVCQAATTPPEVDPGQQNVKADSACNVEKQSGCPAGRVCLVSNNLGDSSCYSTGAGKLGEACANVNDCAPGLLCYSGNCRQRCQTKAECKGGPYASCDPFESSATQAPVAALSTCAPHCNPADPQNAAKSASFGACAAGDLCFPVDTSVRGASDCFLAGAQPLGGSCMGTQDCSPGNVCLTDPNGTTGTCLALCLMKGTRCAKGACQSFGEALHVGVDNALVEVGFCE